MSSRQRKGPPPPQPVREPGTRAPRPADAATVIIWRRRGRTVEVLMGERHRAHRFLPQRYVFPGGRVDAADARVRAADDLSPAVAEQLARTTRPGRARSIGIAAIRETFEETGLIIGGRDPLSHRPPPRGWERFFGAGYAPALGRLEYIARAITPAFRPLRFDARFFIVPEECVDGALTGSGELEHLDWIPIGDTRDIELAVVTRAALRIAEGHIASPPRPSATRRVPYLKYTPDGHELIGQ